MKSFSSQDVDIFYAEYGDCKASSDRTLIIWGHGWGQDHQAFDPLISGIKNADHIALDFPGFGASPNPSEVWGTKEYALALIDFFKKFNRPLFWAGHSFGGRVGLQLGTIAPNIFQGFILISAAGLKRKRPLHEQAKLWSKVRIFKTFKFMTKFGVPEDWVMKNFTNTDYKNAGPMRQIFVKVVNEDLTKEASKMPVTTLLLYGSEDTETPPEIGERLNTLIPESKLIVLDGHDHYTILQEGRHILAKHITEFITR